MSLTTPLAIAAGGILVAGAIVFGPRFSGPRYQIAPSIAADGSPFVWRLDTVSGDVESCTFEKVDNPFARIGEHGETLSPVRIVCLTREKQPVGAN